MKSIKFEVKGTTPLMLNNPQVVNPFNSYAKAMKEITSKRKKTEEDNQELFRLKFLASIYQDNSGRYIIPSEQFKKSLEESAKENKLGKEFIRSSFIFDNAVIDFADKDKSPEQLYEIGTYVDIRDCGVRGARIPVARFIIPTWSTTIEVFYNEEKLEEDEVVKHMEIAGLRYGVGTYRQKFGKFEIKKV